MRLEVRGEDLLGWMMVREDLLTGVPFVSFGLQVFTVKEQDGPKHVRLDVGWYTPGGGLAPYAVFLAGTVPIETLSRANGFFGVNDRYRCYYCRRVVLDADYYSAMLRDAEHPPLCECMYPSKRPWSEWVRETFAITLTQDGADAVKWPESLRWPE